MVGRGWVSWKDSCDARAIDDISAQQPKLHSQVGQPVTDCPNVVLAEEGRFVDSERQLGATTCAEDELADSALACSGRISRSNGSPKSLWWNWRTPPRNW